MLMISSGAGQMAVMATMVREWGSDGNYRDCDGHRDKWHFAKQRANQRLSLMDSDMPG